MTGTAQQAVPLSSLVGADDVLIRYADEMGEGRRK